VVSDIIFRVNIEELLYSHDGVKQNVIWKFLKLGSKISPPRDFNVDTKSSRDGLPIDFIS
jgi:hypothetical protein